jgi:hypothetical protein
MRIPSCKCVKSKAKTEVLCSRLKLNLCNHVAIIFCQYFKFHVLSSK